MVTQVKKKLSLLTRFISEYEVIHWNLLENISTLPI